MPGRLAQKRCLIVGGTSGIGLAAAGRFLDEGAALVVAGLPDENADDARQQLQAHGPVQLVLSDARVGGQVDRLFDQALAHLGGLDVLYHAAGASGRKHGDGPLHECSETGWQATLDSNLKSTFLTNRAAVGHFLRMKQAGVILNMASVLALAPSPLYFDTCAYAASKGGIVAMSRLAAARYGPDGIRVNVLAPALVQTPMAARAVNDPEVLHFLRTKQPLTAGPILPQDCSEAAVFLCSDAARLITGTVLPVDAGWCVSEGQYS